MPCWWRASYRKLVHLMSELARRYALAYFHPDQPEEEAFDPLRQVMDCAPLWQLLCSPAEHPGEKAAVLKALPLWTPDARPCRFLCLLAEKGRCALLPDILTACHELYLQAENTAACTLSYARKPSQEQLEKLRAALCRKHNKTDIEFTLHEDTTLLGGFILELEGITYDQSVRGHLQALGRQLKEVHAPCE